MFVLQEVKPRKVRVEITEALGNQTLTKEVRDNAVIVAGDTLAIIQADEELSKEFIDLCEKANVVLACRVSPKQKAEIVQMMRARNPDKATVAIGDGSNDVNMITAAHIGIGISGLEGQQAARAADYSIGQFRFLKNLLFHHGRENYRRNTYAISYIFYKNVLLVMPIWYFGWKSLFSGQQIYNFQLYALYNVIFTAAPIVWFTTWDKEYEAERLLKRPALYHIGLENVYFNGPIFWRWFFYAAWQGILLIEIIFTTLTSISQNENGRQGSMFAAGNFTLPCVVIVSNIKLLISSYQLSWVLILFVFVSIAAFMACFWFVTWYSAAADDFGVFYELLQNIETYVVLFFFMSGYILVDTGNCHANLEFRALSKLRNA